MDGQNLISGRNKEFSVFKHSLASWRAHKTSVKIWQKVK